MTGIDTSVTQEPEQGFRRLRFLKHGAIYGSSLLLVRGISVLLLPFYTRVLSPADYGVMETIGIAVMFLTTALPLEISQAVGRFFTESRDQDERRAIASTSLWFTLAVLATFAVLPFLLAPELSRWALGSESLVNVVRVASVGFVLQGLFYQTMEQLRWQIKPKQHAITGVTTTLALIAVTAYMILGLHTGVIGIFYGQLAGNVIGVGLALWFGRSSYAFHFEGRRLGQMLAYSVPLVPSTAAVVTALMVDRIAVRSLMSLASLGVYSIAYRFATVISVVMFGVNGAFMPLVLSHHRERATPAAIADVFRYFVYLATLIFLGMSLFSGWILRVMTTPTFYGAGAIVPFVVLAVTFSSMGLFAPGLQLAKRTKPIAAVNIAAAVTNAMLVFLLIPYFGLVGAAMGTAISFFASFAVLMAMSQREYPVPHQWRRLGTAFVIAVAAVVAERLLVRAEPAAENAATLLIEAAIFVAVGAAVSLLLLDRREVGLLAARISARRRGAAVLPGNDAELKGDE
jgi:O-antigen/teichoic acid export membrane protein